MFGSVLLYVRAGKGAAAAVSAARRLAPRPERVHLVVFVESDVARWPLLDALWDEAPPDASSLIDLEPLLDGWAGALDGEAILRLDAAQAVEDGARRGADAILVGPLSDPARPPLGWLESVAARAGLPVVWLGATGTPGPRAGSGRHFLCPYEGDARRVAPVVGFLRSHAGPADRATFLGVDDPSPPPDPGAVSDLVGLACHVAIERLEAGPVDVIDRLAAYASAHGVDALVLSPASFGAVTRGVAAAFAAWRDPFPRAIVVLPRETIASSSGALDASDALLVEGASHGVVAVDRLGPIGWPWGPFEDDLAAVAGGEEVARATPRGGVARIPRDAIPEPAVALGLARAGASGDVLGHLEATPAIVRLGPTRPVILVDAALPAADALAVLERCRAAEARVFAIAVRVRPRPALREVREALRAGSGPPLPVLDARQVLGDGAVADRPTGVEAVRLLRVARRLRADGVPVVAVISADRPLERAARLAALGPEGARGLDPDALVAAAPPPGPPLLERTGAEARGGNRVRILLRNEEARTSLLERIAAARHRIHLETYIVREDPVTAEIERALRAAAERGVRVRAIVDSLLSLHGSLGRTNPLLDRLAQVPGCEVRAYRPVERLPGLVDLKQRSHRKLWVFDGLVARVSGRNLAREYFTGFDEARLGPTSPAEDVPWLDAGVEAEGPVVRDVEACFLADWQRLEGDGFELREVGAAGSSEARLVVHDGLEDANTLEAQLSVIEGARSHIYVANTFPVTDEIREALSDALARGVQVRLLVGSVAPVHGELPERFAGGWMRELAMQLVLGRLDALVEAGAEAFQLAVPRRPGWSEALGPVRPHVHAKVLTADGRTALVGSANLDVTAAYWESEAVVVVDDSEVAAALERDLDALLRTSVRIDPTAPAWKTDASRRAWLTRLWPSMVG